MRIIIAGGSGQLGGVLARWFSSLPNVEVQIIGREAKESHLKWDGRSDGEWMESIDGADAVINVAGRSVSCRYHWANLNEMMRSRIHSTLAIGRAIAKANHPPKVWLQASTASIYAHRFDQPNDEIQGIIGDNEPNVPAYWGYSVSIAQAWELALESANTPHTRKVALRTGFTMNPEAGSVFDWLMWLVRHRLAGAFLGGRQYVSWIHDLDLARACEFLIHSNLSGQLIWCRLLLFPNGEFMRILGRAAGIPFSFPIIPGMAEIGAWFLNTDIELMKKSRYVIPRRLIDAGFSFQMADWKDAAPDLVARWRAIRSSSLSSLSAS